MSHPDRQIECTIPILPVRDLTRSIRFYTETLGFKLDWGGEDGDAICSVSKDGHCIMLSRSAEGSPGVWVWVGLEDDSLFHLYRSRGVKVRQEPMNYSWAYEMKFEDIDGNVLWLGTEPRTDLPLEDTRHG
ncbi:MAG: VOC family protein [Planctomycetales bacterium]|nr:VOC family protein [Planctomycetales bacterium]